MGKKQRRKTATRERLLDAAEMLFAQKGYNGITVPGNHQKGAMQPGGRKLSFSNLSMGFVRHG